MRQELESGKIAPREVIFQRVLSIVRAIPCYRSRTKATNLKRFYCSFDFACSKKKILFKNKENPFSTTPACSLKAQSLLKKNISVDIGHYSCPPNAPSEVKAAASNFQPPVEG